MPNNTPTPNNSSALAGAVWLSAREAAAALGVSEKTIWRRAKAGTLKGRKVDGGNGGKVWEIALEPTGQRPDKSDRPIGQNRPDSDRTKKHEKTVYEREPTGLTDRTKPIDRPTKTDRPTGQTDGTDARFMAHLKTENAFLRATIEQLQRDGAEVRAALRAALKLAALQETPQLTAGNAPATGAASSGAQVSPDREPFKPSNRMTGEKSRAAPLTIGDIADQLERDLTTREI